MTEIRLIALFFVERKPELMSTVSAHINVEQHCQVGKIDSPSYDVVNKKDMNYYYTDVSLECRNTPQSSPFTVAKI